MRDDARGGAADPPPRLARLARQVGGGDHRVETALAGRPGRRLRGVPVGGHDAIEPRGGIGLRAAAGRLFEVGHDLGHAGGHAGSAEHGESP